MYLTRRIDTARRFEPHAQSRGEAEVDAGALALELQRSLDYYESHYDQTPVTQLVIAPGDDRASRLAEALRNETSLQISLFDVASVFEVAPGVSADLDWDRLMALGAALRSDRAKA
jgi:MSHA biogenesis protein MshI